MTIAEELVLLVDQEKENDLLLFLKKLGPAQKKELAPGLKKLFKRYSQFTEQGSLGSYRAKWSEKQRRMLGIAGFVCFNKKDFEQHNYAGVINKNVLKELLPWYCPDWFDALINSYADASFVPFFLGYDWYMELVERGYVSSHPPMIAKLLPQYIFTPLKRGYTCDPEKLLIRPVTLEEHIWHLFDQETSINWSDRYIHVEEKTRDGHWIDTLKKFSNEQRLDRKRLLEAALRASNKHFNQTLSGWFIELFTCLVPDTQELEQLQPQLFQVLNSPHSKPVNVALKCLKDLAVSPVFSMTDFQQQAGLLLTSEAKTTVATTLMILEKLAKKHPKQRNELVLTISQALMHQDNALQLRAAKLIQKYGDSHLSELKQAVSAYQEALLFDSRNLLIAYLDSEQQDIATPADITEPDRLTAIALPATFDELVYLASQAFDQNAVYHFDLLPAALLHFQGEMTADNISKLLPAFQRAYQLLSSDFTTAIGYLDHMLATFFIDYGQLLIHLHGSAAAGIAQLRESFIRKEKEKQKKWSGYSIQPFSGIRQWDVFTHSTAYKPHKDVLTGALFLMEKQLKLPLLSTPTHEPCWVSAHSLIERLFAYQQNKIAPGYMDLQVAIARCDLRDTGDARTLAGQKLEGDYLQLVAFLLGGPTSTPQRLKAAWLTASLTRAPEGTFREYFSYSNLYETQLTGNFDWTSFIEPYTYKQWDYASGTHQEQTGKHSKIAIHLQNREKQSAILKSLLKRLMPTDRNHEPPLCELIHLKYQYLSAEHNDIKRQLSLMPNQPEPWLAQVMHKSLSGPDFSGENEKKMALHTLEHLLTLNIKNGPMAHLFIASCMISNDKTVRAYAAEIWIRGVAQDTLSSSRIGEIIGIHEKVELAPIKRFSDLALGSMFQVSTQHNQALAALLSACLAQLADQPIANLKKLLDVYMEVLSACRTYILGQEVISRLNIWEQQPNLTASVKKILRFVKLTNPDSVIHKSFPGIL